MNTKYIPRFSFEISEEQQLRANKCFPTYGLRKAIFGRVLDDICEIIETHGGIAIGIMMSGKVKLNEIIPTMKEASNYKRKK